MATGQGIRAAKTNVKPTLDQREHILKHHLEIAVANDRVHLAYVQDCGKNDCPVPKNAAFFMCKQPPCPM
jgi:hypothetical protein